MFERTKEMTTILVKAKAVLELERLHSVYLQQTFSVPFYDITNTKTHNANVTCTDTDYRGGLITIEKLAYDTFHDLLLQGLEKYKEGLLKIING